MTIDVILPSERQQAAGAPFEIQADRVHHCRDEGPIDRHPVPCRLGRLIIVRQSKTGIREQHHDVGVIQIRFVMVVELCRTCSRIGFRGAEQSCRIVQTLHERGFCSLPCGHLFFGDLPGRDIALCLPGIPPGLISERRFRTAYRCLYISDREIRPCDKDRMRPVFAVVQNRDVPRFDRWIVRVGDGCFAEPQSDQLIRQPRTHFLTIGRRQQFIPFDVDEVSEIPDLIIDRFIRIVLIIIFHGYPDAGDHDIIHADILRIQPGDDVHRLFDLEILTVVRRAFVPRIEGPALYAVTCRVRFGAVECSAIPSFVPRLQCSGIKPLDLQIPQVVDPGKASGDRRCPSKHFPVCNRLFFRPLRDLVIAMWEVLRCKSDAALCASVPDDLSDRGRIGQRTENIGLIELMHRIEHLQGDRGSVVVRLIDVVRPHPDLFELPADHQPQTEGHMGPFEVVIRILFIDVVDRDRCGSDDRGAQCGKVVIL